MVIRFSINTFHEYLFVALFSLIVCSTACTKSADNGQGGPVIIVTSPSSNQQFTAGQNITVSASITHTSQIHEVKVRVRNNATGAEILEFKVDVNATSYDVSRSFIAQAGVVYKIEIEAEDYMGNESEKEFTIIVN